MTAKITGVSKSFLRRKVGILNKHEKAALREEYKQRQAQYAEKGTAGDSIIVKKVKTKQKKASSPTKMQFPSSKTSVIDPEPVFDPVYTQKELQTRSTLVVESHPSPNAQGIDADAEMIDSAAVDEDLNLDGKNIDEAQSIKVYVKQKKASNPRARPTLILANSDSSVNRNDFNVIEIDSTADVNPDQM